MGMRTGPALLAVAVLFALAGCVPSAPHSSAAPSASATPVFASDAEALAAAEKAYAAYEAAVDESLQAGRDMGLSSVATGAALANAVSSVSSFISKNQTQRGRSKVTRVTDADLSALRVPGGPSESAQIYACLDISAVMVLDSVGREVTGANEQKVFPTLVGLTWIPRSRKLLVSEETVWDGHDFCN